MGKLNNVYLSEEERQTLTDDLGAETAEKYIDDLSLYIGEPKNAAKYTDHYLTILRWARKDRKQAEENKVNAPVKSKSFADIARDHESSEREPDPIWDVIDL